MPLSSFLTHLAILPCRFLLCFHTKSAERRHVKGFRLVPRLLALHLARIGPLINADLQPTALVDKRIVHVATTELRGGPNTLRNAWTFPLVLVFVIGPGR